MLYNVRDILLSLHLRNEIGTQNGTRQQGLQHMFKQYNVIHIITSLALDNDVAIVWILTVVKYGNNTHMFDKVCGSVFRGSLEQNDQ